MFPTLSPQPPRRWPRQDKLGRTALHNAVAAGCDELAKGLLEEKVGMGLRLSLRKKNRNGRWSWKLQKLTPPKFDIWVFPKLVIPQIIHFNRVFHYKPSIFWVLLIFGNTHLEPRTPKLVVCVEGFSFSFWRHFSGSKLWGVPPFWKGTSYKLWFHVSFQVRVWRE